MDYLVYVRCDGENLQFYLWLIDYFQRFMHAPKSEQELSPMWNFNNPACSSIDCPLLSRRLSGHTIASLGTQDVQLEKTQGLSDRFPEEMQEALYSEILSSLHTYDPEVLGSLHTIDTNETPLQPFRLEIDRIVSHYIAVGSPRELNLSHKDRTAVLHALRHTTHPSAFFPIRDILDSILRKEAHPSFIRWSICNGNKPRTIFLRFVGAAVVISGFLIAICLTLSSVSRWWRIFAALAWWFGITNLVAAYKGLCILLHRRRTRFVRPWEIGDDELGISPVQTNDVSSLHSSTIPYVNTMSRWPVKMEVFGSSNESLKEYWQDTWQKKPLYRKIFDKQVRVHEQGLALVQNRIVRQAEAWALIITIPLTAVFIALPRGSLY